MGRNFKDITGQKFGMLLVLERIINTKVKTHKDEYWKCLCDCGNETIIRKSSLFNKAIMGCGCQKGKWIRPKRTQSKMINKDTMIKAIHTSYRRNAADRDYDFLLTIEEVGDMILRNCYYCGNEPKNDWRKGFKYNGIDRIDNSKGYEKSNCVPCCKNCNRMKGTMDEDLFLKHIVKIYENLNQEKGN